MLSTINPRKMRKHVRQLCYWVVLTLGMLIVIMMLQPLRNRVLFVWPRIWHDVSSTDVLRMYSVLWISTPVDFPSPVCPPEPEQDAATQNDQRLSHYLTNLTRSYAAEAGGTLENRHVLPDSTKYFVLDPARIPAEVAAMKVQSSAAFERSSETLKKAEHWLSQSGEREAKYGHFRPTLQPADTQKIVEMMMTLDLACRVVGVRYFLVAGSLLGLYRHGGLIPWDDDIDIVIDVSQAETAWKVLSCLPGYTLRVIGGQGTQWKLFFTSTTHPPTKVGFPFLDIFLFTWNDHYLWSITDFAFAVDLTFRLSDVLPLVSQTFEGIQVVVPARVRAILDTTFDVGVCASPSHDHKKGVGLYGSNVTRTGCTELRDMYTMFHLDP